MQFDCTNLAPCPEDQRPTGAGATGAGAAHGRKAGHIGRHPGHKHGQAGIMWDLSFQLKISSSCYTKPTIRNHSCNLDLMVI